MNLTYKDGLCKIEATWNGPEFKIVIEEAADVYNVQNCHTIFRTPKGLYSHDFQASKELIEDVSITDFLRMCYDNAFDWYEKNHGGSNYKPNMETR